MNKKKFVCLCNSHYILTKIMWIVSWRYVNKHFLQISISNYYKHNPCLKYIFAAINVKNVFLKSKRHYIYMPTIKNEVYYYCKYSVVNIKWKNWGHLFSITFYGILLSVCLDFDVILFRLFFQKMCYNGSRWCLSIFTEWWRSRCKYWSYWNLVDCFLMYLFSMCKYLIEWWKNFIFAIHTRAPNQIERKKITVKTLLKLIFILHLTNTTRFFLLSSYKKTYVSFTNFDIKCTLKIWMFSNYYQSLSNQWIKFSPYIS